MTDQDDGGGEAATDRLLAPISGLLAVVFAAMTGASLSYALSGPPALFVVPAFLGAASVGCMLLKRRLEAAPTGGADPGDDEGSGSGDDAGADGG